MQIAEVVIDVSSNELNKVFDYKVSANLCEKIKVGSFVLVPFGAQKNVFGFVTNLKNSTNVEISKLKEILCLAREDVFLNQKQITLANKISEKFYLRKIDVLRLFLPPDLRKQKQIITTESFCAINIENLNKLEPRKNATKQIDLKNYLLEQNTLIKTSELNKLFGATTVKFFLKNNVLVEELEKKKNTFLKLDISPKKINLTTDQQNVINSIEKSSNKLFLIHGVTGSGKTEVYLELIKNVLTKNQTAIMLVPEISLTPQIYTRFVERFGSNIAVLHSGLTPMEKYLEWERIAKGEAKVVVGARSAIFAPINNLGIIVIDEEHDSSYISESNPRYNTYEVAKLRLEVEGENTKLVLGSATPSIETYYKATRTNEIELLNLASRVGKASLPELVIIDMHEEILRGNTGIFSARLLTELENTINNKKQAIIFINRRGFSSFLRCSKCGYIPKCTSCDVSLVYHKIDNELKCHFCGKRFKAVNMCEKCGNDAMNNGGVGSQRILEELSKIYPNVKILRLDNDTSKNKEEQIAIINNFAKTYPAILVGTQMVSKGHDFSGVNLVGIIDADLSLHFADFRSIERTFSLVTQVAGRAGRGEILGKCLLQTYSKNHFVFKYASKNDYVGFFEKELNLREVTAFPPFTKLVRILIASEVEDLARHIVVKVFNQFKILQEQNKNAFVYLDAMKSPVKRIKNKFRYQILIRLNKNHTYILKDISDIVLQNNTKGVTMFIETDPQNLS